MANATCCLQKACCIQKAGYLQKAGCLLKACCLQKIAFRFVVIMCLLLLLSNCKNMYRDNKLFYDSKGKFKIAQFTDLHIKLNNPLSDDAFNCITNVINKENPNLIIITGDMIYSTPAKDNFNKLLNFINNFKIPFGFVFGNHDREFSLSNKELLDIAKSYEYNLTTTAEGVVGESNYDIPIYSNRCNKVETVIYCFDSHSLLHPVDETGNVKYDYIKSDQIDWYNKRSAFYTQNNDNKPVKSLVFLHIPIPEYDYAMNSNSAPLVGTVGEKACCPEYNSGLFAAFKKNKDVIGVFCGHDHDNDFCTIWDGILLAYGRFTGGKTEYFNLKINGARIIELSENENTINTWIRTCDGEIESQVLSPNDF